jgi:hypothetical protein
VHRNAPLCEWQRNPARPDPKLERASAPGKLDEEVNCRGHDLAVEHLRQGLVVSRGNALVEVIVHIDSRARLLVHRNARKPAIPVQCQDS